MSNDEAKIVTPEQLLAAIPAMLGYMPVESLIVIHGDNEGRMDGAVRVPITVDHDELQRVAEALNERTPDGGVVLIMVSANPSKAIDASKVLAAHLELEIREVIGVPSLNEGAVFMSLINDLQGKVPNWQDSAITAEVVADGKRVFESEGEIYELYEPHTDVEPIARLRTVQCANLIALMADTIRNPTNPAPSPGQIGSVLMFGPGSRDLAIQMVGISPARAHTVFAHASRFIRGRARVEALTIAGIAAYIDNSGSLAAAAFKAAWETALLMDPPFNSELLEAAAAAYHQGMKAELFAKAVFASFDEHEQEGGETL